MTTSRPREFGRIRRYPLKFALPGVQARMLATRSKYKAFDAVLRRIVSGKRVLDVGSGSGILALIAAFRGAREVVALERPRVAWMTREVIGRYKQEVPQIEVIEKDLFDWRSPGRRFDVIMSETLGYLGYEENIQAILYYAKHRFGGLRTRIIPRRLKIMMQPCANGIGVGPILVSDYAKVKVAEVTLLRGDKERLLDSPPEKPILITSTFRSLRDQELRSVVVTFRANLGLGERISNGPPTAWPHCSIGLPKAIHVVRGSAIAMGMSLRPAAGSFHTKFQLHTSDGESASCSFSTGDIPGEPAGWSYGSIASVVRAVDTLLLQLRLR